jgi:acetyl esterase/lipase
MTTVPGGTGGTTSIPSTGGTTSATGGTTSTTSKTGGATSLPGSGGTAGGAQVTGGSVTPSGGTAATGGSTKAIGGTASGGAALGGSSGATGGTGGTTSTGPLPPPVRDTASKVPISSPPAGYTVEGNYPYGLLTAQRIDILYPTGGGPKATQVLPVVVMYHGGAWIHSYTNNYGSGKDHMSTFFDRFLAHGFIVCNAEYRVNDGTADGAPAPAAVQDALLAAKWCWDYMDYFHGDRTKYVVTGASAGGHLALMVGMATPAAGLGPTSPSDFTIAGIVDGYGPADIEAEINGVAAGWLPTSLPNRAAIAKQVNPMTYVRKDVPPLIVVQGANDNTAPVADSLKLVANLQAAGDTDVTMHEVAGAGHGFATPATAWPDAEKAMFDWLTAKGMGK